MLPNSSEEVVQHMLKAVGVASIDKLFSDIPDELMLKRGLNLPKGRSEVEVERIVETLLSKNSVYPEYLCFLGGGVWPHHVPAAVDEIISRSEFYTSYTPYQPEISQGMLQALFEYQSLICDLTGMAAANSSMYDWATAVGEAARLAHRVTKRRRIVASRAVGPERLEVLKTYCEPAGINVETVDFDHKSGQSDYDGLAAAVDGDTAAIYVENPNFFGVLEESVYELSSIAHASGSLFIVGVDPISLGLIRSPADYGVDIVVGDGQPLGIHMNYGGPLLGILAVKDDQSLIRQMPGRIIGMTTDRKGLKRGFTMVLQTREQHIRREHATSNICTNQALCAVAAAAYLALLGPEGLKKLAELVLGNSHLTAKRISEITGVTSPYFAGPFFKDFAVGFEGFNISGEDLAKALFRHKILGGLPLMRRFKELSKVSLFTTTEIHSEESITYLVNSLMKVLKAV